MQTEVEMGNQISWTQSTDTSTDTPPSSLEAAQLAKILLSFYRIQDSSDPDIYVAGILEIIRRYPFWVVKKVVNPATGIPSKIKYLPLPAQIIEACEAELGPVVRQRGREDAIRRQLSEREEIEAEKMVPPSQTYEEFLAEMAARGMPIGPRRASMSPNENRKVFEKYGITQEMLDRCPDAKKNSTWTMKL